MNAPDIGIEANLRQITTALVSRCAPSPTNPRKHFDEAALAELTASVRQHYATCATKQQHPTKGKGQ